MANNYGPWATPINTGSNPQLSAFWKRRLKMLVPISQTTLKLSGRNLLGLSAAAILMIVLPTFYSIPAAADENKWDRDIKAAIDSSTEANIRALPKSVEDNQSSNHAKSDGTELPSKPSYHIFCRIIDADGAVVMAPQLGLNEGREGIIEDRSQSPFVIGVTSVENVKQPHIVVLKEGTMINVTVLGVEGMAELVGEKDKKDTTSKPTLTSGGATLDVTVEQSKIGNVDRKTVGSGTTIQLPHLDTHKKRVIDFVKFGEVLTIPMGEKSANGIIPRVELVFGPADKFETPSDWKSSVNSLPNIKDAHP